MHIGIVVVINLLVCVISIFLYSKYSPKDFESIQSIDTKYCDENETLYTTHWCFDQQSRICHFQSLCYYPVEDQFVYITNSSSLMEIKSTLPSLSLSSVSELDMFSFVPTYINQNFSKLKIRWLDGFTMLFKRFKPDNIMHVIHDDVLPLYHTLQFLGQGNLKVLFMDDFSPGLYELLYKLLSDVRYKPMASEQELICFENAFIGVSSLSKWYQYGYNGNVQGPVVNDRLTSFYLRSAGSFIIKKLNFMPDNQYIGDYLVLISRTETRKLLNEEELITNLKINTKMKILTISDDDISEVIHIVQTSRGIIGMHGALLILGLFLRPGSILIELFPYAVNPDNYTPYRTLASIPGMSIIYHTWRNMDKSKSFSHPDYPPEEGGIRHLSEEVQREIMDQEEVPVHGCCSDPSWLFHINQDTAVNVEEVVRITQKALSESQQQLSPPNENEPSVVRHLSCSCINDKLVLHWEHPWNLDYINGANVQYMIGVQSRKLNSYSVFIVNVNIYSIEDGIDCSDEYDVWVNAEINDVKGEVKYVKC
ncbi:protein O-linked-mannose beta-1,4-N-acetylglucosaminyltransferase 2-like [Saccostrea echinata]|uniref:protein O-linked-mannose beta-1,4-N-acetylglucosaminyltransferase 2-like n=1 Tax=Saccostrea echinata TaxID=191078 RepID=UPI002A7EA8CD|nr:protein O-linked-mannose beta-1,4-N-acetylglucosaminyltransferase 2-like [Saccostrea echinata]